MGKITVYSSKQIRIICYSRMLHNVRIHSPPRNESQNALAN